MNFKELEKRVNRVGNISYWDGDTIVGKRCSKCGEDKHITKFKFSNKQKAIYYSSCKECDKRYREENAEHIKEYQKQWRENNPKYSEEYNKQWRQNNVEHRREYGKQWREDNKEHIKEYREDNKEHRREYNKQWHQENKENNLKEISNMIELINPILKNLPTYGYIYKFRNINTGRIYIGQTITPLKIRYGTEIINSWIKERKHYGKQKFLNELIEEDFEVTEVLDVGCCQYHLDKLEAYYIDKYNSCENGYNNNVGYHRTDDGIKEFERILKENNLKYINGELRRLCDE